MRFCLVSLLLILPLGAARAQAHAGCPEHPHSLAAMQGCYRPLLVFSPSATDPRWLQQERLLDHDADDMMDRDVVLLPVLTNARGYKPPLDAPSITLPPQELAMVRKRFGVAASRFVVVLLGEDGSAKLRESKPVSTDTLNGLIDTMPTRRQEMQQPHSN
ncbi:DUF4174 domain-containing protein [Acidipila sp. EB88]|uniref:DUF4174 domain-containing protein n=1 Tax=Acidipila sp. EB88 TaxID=2305226 RepID=UPI000F5F9C45|nr:DUF4174 domain-containing protein [Acidipila sp. EB88]RRA48848.1 DUF4174 domain-containing protein [Acidipila sp. EB88]